MGPSAGAVHRLEHGAQPFVITQGLKHQQAAVEHDLEGPSVEAGQCESHGGCVVELVSPLLRHVVC